MSSAKAALESDTRVSVLSIFRISLSAILFFVCLFSPYLRIFEILFNYMLFQVLAFEAGRKHKIRVNTISAGIGDNSF